MNKWVSLCIPTNGIIEWVLPVIDSIYAQDVDLNLYEVIVADNGNNSIFEKKMQELRLKYKNLVYRRTSAPGFLNQIECFDLATGKLIKFVNHRMPLKAGSIKKFIELSQKYYEIRPTIFFMNGCHLLEKKIKTYNSFDEYVSGIGYFASWSGGTALWKEDFTKQDLSYYNELFPHIGFVLLENMEQLYVVDNEEIFDTLKDTDERKKGKYLLYKAFSVELPAIFLNMVKDNKIEWDTYDMVMKQIESFVSNQYLQYEIYKKSCSYDLTGFNRYTNVFFNSKRVVFFAYLRYIRNLLRHEKW